MMSAKDWQDWDRIQAVIYALGVNTRAIQEHAARIEQAVKALPARTMGSERIEDDLEGAISQLSVTVALCRSALEAFDKLPIILREAAE